MFRYWCRGDAAASFSADYYCHAWCTLVCAIVALLTPLPVFIADCCWWWYRCWCFPRGARVIDAIMRARYDISFPSFSTRCSLRRYALLLFLRDLRRVFSLFSSRRRHVDAMPIIISSYYAIIFLRNSITFATIYSLTLMLISMREAPRKWCHASYL